MESLLSAYSDFRLSHGSNVCLCRCTRFSHTATTLLPRLMAIRSMARSIRPVPRPPDLLPDLRRPDLQLHGDTHGEIYGSHINEIHSGQIPGVKIHIGQNHGGQIHSGPIRKRCGQTEQTEQMPHLRQSVVRSWAETTAEDPPDRGSGWGPRTGSQDGELGSKEKRRM